MNNKKNKAIAFMLMFSIIISIICFVPCEVKATTEVNYKLSINRAPRKKIITNDKEKIIIKLNDGDGVSYVKLEQYINDKDTTILIDTKEGKNVNNVSISSDKSEIQIKSNLFSKENEYIKFKLTVKDGKKSNPNDRVSTFKIKKLSNVKKENSWYAVKDSPRIYYSKNEFKIKGIDNSGIKSIIVKDLNNKKIKVQTSGTGETRDLDINSIVKKDDKYHLLVTVIDNTDMINNEEVVIKAQKYVTKQINNQTLELPGVDRVYFLDTQDKKSNGKISTSDAFIIESDGKYGMIDTSTSNFSSRIQKYIDDLGIKELDFVLLTHMHLDHVGGYTAIAKKTKINNLYIREYNSGTHKGTYEGIVKFANNKKTKIHLVNKGDTTIKLGNYRFQLYNTEQHSVEAAENNENINSITAIAKVNNRKIYFASDIENYKKGDKAKGDEAEINVAKKVGKVDVYKVAHHSYGYKNINNSSEALTYLKPTYSVVTNSKNKLNTVNAHKRIVEYGGTKEENFYYSADGTVILNIEENGNMTFQKLKEEKSI